MRTDDILRRFDNVKQTGDGQYMAQCPGHDDNKASLAIGIGDGGRTLLHCQAGCTTEAVCEAAGLRVSDLMPESNGKPQRAAKAKSGDGKPHIVATYDYRDEPGELLHQVCRLVPKDFRQRRPRPGGGWDWQTKNVRRVPYRLPELIAAPETRPVFVAEGEEDVHALEGIGAVATCNPGGAGKWMDAYSEHLRGRHVVILPDNDNPGRHHAESVARSLHGISTSVRVVELPGLPEKGDIRDWLRAGHTKDELARLVKATPEWQPDAQPWPDLDRFDDVDLPLFPVDALPDPLREWVTAEAHATQTPPDLAALLALAVCAAAIARRVEVEARPGWRDPCNIFAAVVLDPGNRKSAVFRDALAPLREIESELIEDARPTIARLQSERRQMEGRQKALEKKAAGGDTEAGQQAGELAERLATEPEPCLPRLLVDDATSEKLGAMLAGQGGRLASMSPEGSVFDLLAGMYSKSGMANFGVYLMGHAGDDLIVDRLSRQSVRVESPALTVAYTIQRAVVQGLAEHSAFRGRGLLARFLYGMPRSRIGSRRVNPEPVREAVTAAYRDSARRLFRDFEDIESASGVFIFRLDPRARTDFIAWEAAIESMLADGGDCESMRDWGAKLAGATLRLAGILHAVQWGNTATIDADTLAAAMKIARYLVPHAESVLNLMQATEDSTHADARYVLAWILRHGREEFSKRDLQQHGKRRFRKADDLDAPLGELERRGYIRRKPTNETPSPGRPASPTFQVNPAVAENENPEKRPHNSHNSGIGPENVDSGNIGGAFRESKNTNRERVTI